MGSESRKPSLDTAAAQWWSVLGWSVTCGEVLGVSGNNCPAVCDSRADDRMTGWQDDRQGMAGGLWRSNEKAIKNAVAGWDKTISVAGGEWQD